MMVGQVGAMVDQERAKRVAQEERMLLMLEAAFEKLK